jgi:hypothetical protein
VTLSRLRTARVVVGSIAVAVAAAACSSGGPTGTTVTTADIAKHYDVLAGAYLADQNPNVQAIGQAISLFNGAVAAGQSPSPSNVNALVSRGWLGNVVDLVDSAQTDSIQIVSLWFTGNITAVIQSFFHNGTFVTALATDSGGSILSTDTSNMIVSVSPTAGTCVFTTITNTSTVFPTFAPSTSACEFAGATFSGILHLGHDTTSASAPLDSVVLSPQHVLGVRLHFNTAADFQLGAQHVLGLAQALRAQRRSERVGQH